MPHFYFHLMIRDELHSDEIGLELPSVEAAYLEAFAAAKEMWSELLVEGQDPTVRSFEIADADGVSLITLPFTEVLATAQKSAPAQQGF